MKQSIPWFALTFCLGLSLFSGSHGPIQPTAVSAAEATKPSASSYVTFLQDQLGAKGRLEFVGGLVRFNKDKNGPDTFVSLGDDLVCFETGSGSLKVYCHLSQIVFVVPKFQL